MGVSVSHLISADERLPFLVAAVAVPLLLALLLGRDPFPTVPGTKYIVPWQLKTLEFVDNRLQYSLTEFARHGNIFKARLFGERVLVLGGPDAVKLAADTSSVASTARSFYFSNRNPPNCPGRPAPMIISDKNSQHDMKRKIFHTSLLNISNEPAFFGDKLPDLFDYHFQKAAGALSPVHGVDVCKSIFWDMCVNMFFSDVSEKGDFTTAVLNWVLSSAVTQTDLVKASLFGVKKVPDMSLIDNVFSNEVRIRMSGGWSPGGDAIGEMLKAAMEISDTENMSSVVDKTLLTDGWNFIFASNVKLVSACCWLLVALENSPDAKAAAITEARNYPLSGELSFSLTSLSDRRILPYIGHVVDEVIRMYGCLSLPDFTREAIEEVVFENHKIPKGSILIMPLEYHNFHPINFPDPEDFDPNRFFSKDDQPAKCKVHSIASFGFGEHSCPGAGFSKAVMKLFAYTALRRYDFAAAAGQSFEPLAPSLSGELWHIPADRLRFGSFTCRVSEESARRPSPMPSPAAESPKARI